MVTTTAAAPKEWPNPEQDPLVFVANPVEAEMPGHWVPLSIVKVILERPSTTTPKPTWPRPSSTLKPTKAPHKPEKLHSPVADASHSKEKTKEESIEKTKEQSKEKTEEEPAEEPAEAPESEKEEDPAEDPPEDPPEDSPEEDPPKKKRRKPQDAQHNLNVKKR